MLPDTGPQPGPPVRGVQIDEATRCVHYQSARDVVAIRMYCCGEYYACRSCHDALADHPAARWPMSLHDEVAVLCGICRREMSIAQYLRADDRCAGCGAEFNPRCRLHRPLYFMATDR